MIWYAVYMDMDEKDTKREGGLRSYITRLWNDQNKSILVNENVSDCLQSAASLLFVLLSPNLLTILALISAIAVPIYFTHCRRSAIDYLDKIVRDKYKDEFGFYYKSDDIHRKIIQICETGGSPFGINIHHIEALRAALVIIAAVSLMA